MLVRLPKKQVDHLIEGGMVIARYANAMHRRWDDPQEIDLQHLAPDGVDWVAENGDDQAKRKVATFRRLMADPKGTKVGKLENIPALVRAVLKECPNKWLFSEDKRGKCMLPWFVVQCKYERGEKDVPATCSIELVAYSHNGNVSKSKTWHHEDIAGKSIYELLDGMGCCIETPELVAAYRLQIDRYLELRKLVGVQMNAMGVAKMLAGRWDSKDVAMELDGMPTKVVLDEYTPELSEREHRPEHKTVSMRFWSTETDDEKEEVPYEVPTHPNIYVFSLRRHAWVEIHVDNLTTYEWNDTIEGSLVLPERDKRLVRLLIESTGQNMADIVAGKSGGVIVLASGEPGTGKTLTAEVTSELLHKPMYSVQCSQLGTNETQIEGKLGTVLARASRWGAVMLIDEADVYIRERGTDIQQNAIVGVFLRTLEYYNGFLFMTTNRATIVDDAILSRLTAHVRYSLPDEDARAKIIRVQADALGVEVPDDVANEAKTLQLSGRDIRNVLKLAKFVAAAEGKVLDSDMLAFCMSYQDLTKPQ